MIKISNVTIQQYHHFFFLEIQILQKRDFVGVFHFNNNLIEVSLKKKKY